MQEGTNEENKGNVVGCWNMKMQIMKLIIRELKKTRPNLHI